MRRSIVAALFLAAMSAPVLAGAQVRLAVAGSEVTVTRLCEVYSRGDMYCRNVDQLLENEWRTVDPAALQASFRKIYADRGLNQRHNGLMSCGSGTFAAAPQSRGPMPTTQDLTAGRNSCLKELEKQMGSRAGGRGRGRDGVFGGAPWRPGSGGGSSWTGTTCRSAGDPTRGQEVSESEYREELRKWYTRDANKLQAAADATTDDEDRKLLESMVKDAEDMAREQQRLRDAAKREEDLSEHVEPLVPEGGDGGKGRSGAGQSTCQEVDARIRGFLDECDRNGWTSYECQKMKACSDPAVTDPIPSGDQQMRGSGKPAGDGENRGNPGMRCGNVDIFGDDDLGRAMQGYCNERARFGPDGGGLCAEFDPSGGVRHQGNDGSAASVARAACGMRALTENGCPVSLSAESIFPSFRRSFQQELVNAQAKLGGPVVVLPVNNPAVGPGGPRGPRPPASAQTRSTGRPTP